MVPARCKKPGQTKTLWRSNAHRKGWEESPGLKLWAGDGRNDFEAAAEWIEGAGRLSKQKKARELRDESEERTEKESG